VCTSGEIDAVIDSGRRPETIAGDGRGYYWTIGSGIFFAPPRVTPQRPFASADGVVAWLGAWFDEEYVYWVDADRSRLVRVAIPSL
jgi:hypothetical protein